MIKRNVSVETERNVVWPDVRGRRIGKVRTSALHATPDSRTAAITSSTAFIRFRWFALRVGDIRHGDFLSGFEVEDGMMRNKVVKVSVCVFGNVGGEGRGRTRVTRQMKY